MTADLTDLQSFGDVAAEDDAVLEYFVSTNAVAKVADGSAFLVLGRKGTGKTAIVRHFTEQAGPFPSRPLNLRNYPWGTHATRVDYGASDIEAYVASWRYLIAVELASLVVAQPKSDHSLETSRLRAFLKDNYGGPDPTLGEILRPQRLRLSNISLQPSVMGNAIGGVDLERKGKDHQFGLELEAVTTALLKSVIAVAKDIGVGALSLHFDELDQGLSTLDAGRSKMLVGLVLAARSIRREGAAASILLHPVVYLRSDLWDELEFSDKNKINQSLTLHLEWDGDSLKELIDQRLRAKLGAGVGWDDVASHDLMRGSQSKWNHIVARTFLRPRDVISFCNIALAEAKKRAEQPVLIENPDIIGSRASYSRYLKQELDDEVMPHWSRWEEALQACSAISTITFERSEFEGMYNQRRSADNLVSASDALGLLYRFSVIGYEKRSGYGGTGWVFQYSDADAGWDNASTKFKVHPGLKEFAKLREARTSAWDGDW